MTSELRVRSGGAIDAGVPAPGMPGRWPIRRLFPLIVTAGLIAIGMTTTTVLEPHMLGTSAWSLPDDLWGTLMAAQRLVQLNPGGLYTQPTGLITFPGAAVILAPVVAVSDVVGLSLSPKGPATRSRAYGCSQAPT